MSSSDLRHLVYVEDDADIREIARIALADIGGLRVDLFASGRQAVETVPAIRPDMILLDMMMPEMDGMETMQALRRRPELAETPMVFLTAKVQQHEVAGYRSRGAADVISKPFDPLTLAERCRQIFLAAGAAPDPASAP